MAYKKGQDRHQRVLFPDCIDEYVEADALLGMILAICSNSIFMVTSIRYVPLVN